MTVPLDILSCGKCEELKTGVHATALGLAVIMGVYNAAAWLRRREPHLAFNAALYIAMILWEQQHVSHHLAELRRAPGQVPAADAAAPPVQIKLAA